MPLWDQHLSPGPWSVSSPTGTETFSRDDLPCLGAGGSVQALQGGEWEAAFPVGRKLG